MWGSLLIAWVELELPVKENADFSCGTPRQETAAAGNFFPLLPESSGDDHNTVQLISTLKQNLCRHEQLDGLFPDLTCLNLLQNRNKKLLSKVNPFLACFSSLGCPCSKKPQGQQNIVVL